MDDQYLVVGNPFIKNWKYLPQMLGQDIWNVSEPTNYWRPVFSLSLALDYSLWGLSPLGFHLTNILLHAISTALLFSLSKKLGSPTCALYAALLFAVHPVQAQAVNHVSARGDVLAAFFALLSLHAFLSRRMVPFALALMFALLSKETSLVLPLALLLAGILIQKDRKDSKLTLAFIILGLYFIVRLSLGFSFSLPELVFSYRASTSDRLLLVFKVLALYFHAIFNLFEMPHPIWTVEIPNSLFDPYVITGILILLLLLAVIWGTVKEKTVIAFGFLWFAIYYLPISNLKQLGLPMNEHWLYTPMIGLSLAFGTAMDALFLLRFSGARLLRLGITTSVMVFLFFAVLVVREKTKLYQSDESFLTAAIRANPEIARLYSLLGNVYIEKRDIPKAQEVYAKALTLDINDLVANYMLGFLLYQAGQQDKAKIHLERVARMEPAIRAEFEPVAHAWEMLGDNQKALFYYRKALDVNPFSAWIQEKVAGLESR
jgi:tetratricopeptide (TPR) repeat protein